jgi:hypothetical protein
VELICFTSLWGLHHCHHNCHHLSIKNCNYVETISGMSPYSKVAIFFMLLSIFTLSVFISVRIIYLFKENNEPLMYLSEVFTHLNCYRAVLELVHRDLLNGFCLIVVICPQWLFCLNYVWKCLVLSYSCVMFVTIFFSFLFLYFCR